jgi:hypothetical protein
MNAEEGKDGEDRGKEESMYWQKNEKKERKKPQRKMDA